MKYIILADNKLNSFFTNYGTTIMLKNDTYDSKFHTYPVISGRLTENLDRDSEIMMENSTIKQITET